MAAELFSSNWESVIALIGAVAALGTAAVGLVDASKAAWGGISRLGFGAVRAGLLPFAPALAAAVGDWEALFSAHWRNGRSKDDQKALAVSLIKLGLDESNAVVVAGAGHADPTEFASLVSAIRHGRDLSAEQINVLGRFSATVEALLDAAFERADQIYRSGARVAAGLAAVALSVAAGAVAAGVTATGFYGYISSRDGAAAVLIGLIAVPVAPVAKDLISSLSAAARAVKAAKL